MNLKNRTLALLTAAALAVPAIAYAKHVKKAGAGSSVVIAAVAGPGVKFNTKSGDSNISVTDNGTDTSVKIDATNLDSGMSGRNEHMWERVFKGKKQVVKGKEVWVLPTDYRYIEVVVPNAAIPKGLVDRKVKAKLKMGGLPKDGIDITIQEFSKDGTKVHGKIVTTLKELKLKDICQDVVVTDVCVKQELVITADVHITEG